MLWRARRLGYDPAERGGAVRQQAEKATAWAALQERGALSGMRLLLGARLLLGRRLCLGILLPVVGFFWATDAGRRRITRDFLLRARRQAGLPPPAWWHGLRPWLNFAGKALDTVVALQRPRAVTVTVSDPDGMVALAAAGGGGIILVAHMGNPDMARVSAAGRLEAGLTVLMHTHHAANYNRLLDRLHGDPRHRTLQVTDLGPGTAMDLHQRIERGEWIAMAADRPPVGPAAPSRVMRVPFLGAPAPFPVGPWILAALLDCPVFLLFCLAEGGGRYRLRLECFTSRVALPRGQRDVALQAVIARYAARLEAEALHAPEQWYNFYDFWS